MLHTCLFMLLSHYDQSTSLTNESMTLPLKPCSPKPSGLKTKFGTPPRRSMAPQAALRGISQILGIVFWMFSLFGNIYYPALTEQRLLTWGLPVVLIHYKNVFISTATGLQEAETTLLRKSILQSTFSDGHFIQPDFDISVIRGKLMTILF